MQELYPQFNYIQVTKDYFLTANGVWELKWKWWGYYTFAIDHSLPEYKIRYEEDIIYCNMSTLRSILRFWQRDTDVFIVFNNKGTFIETVEILSVDFTKYFWKVWEDKRYNTLYCRQKWAKVWGKVMLADDKADTPNLCKVWWHGCYNPSDAIGYKLDDVKDKMYITKMTAHSIVDYWEDKVCCLKASFSKKIRELEYELAENISNNRYSWYKKYVVGDVRDAEFLQILFRKGLIGEFSLKEITKIMDIFKNHTSLKDKYRFYYFRKTEEGLCFSSPHTLFWFDEKAMGIFFIDKGLNKENRDKIIKYCKNRITTVYIYPNEY